MCLPKEEVRLYTAKEVSEILCQGCKVKVSSTFSIDDNEWYHCLNGKKVECLASHWRMSSGKLELSELKKEIS